MYCNMLSHQFTSYCGHTFENEMKSLKSWHSLLRCEYNWKHFQISIEIEIFCNAAPDEGAKTKKIPPNTDFSFY